MSEAKQKLVDRVIDQIKKDLEFENNDITALDELLMLHQDKYLKGYLPEEEWGDFQVEGEHTLVLFEEYEKTFLFKVDKNLSSLDGVYIGELNNDNEKKLLEILFNDDGSYKLEPLEKPTKNWDWFIKCGCV